MTPLRTRLRRALCRHDWQPTTYLDTLGPEALAIAKCRKCGVLRRAEA